MPVNAAAGSTQPFQLRAGASPSTATTANVVVHRADVGSPSLEYLALSGDFGGQPPVNQEWNTYLAGTDIASVDINQLREAFALQRWQEKRALFGARYEDLLHFLGLRTQDARLQQPEFVASKHGTLQFSEVLQTSADANNAGVGELFGHGIGAMRTGRHRYYCWEHGLLMTVLIVRPQAVYTQGVERMWTRETRYDYWHPEFQHIGQQEVFMKEVFCQGIDKDNEVFGYQNRYDEYRRGKNHVTGEFRTTLNYWNMAREFENAPSLNAEFITCNPTDRIYQLSAELSDQLYVMVQNDMIAKRLMSRHGNPV